MPRSGFVLYTNALWYHVKRCFGLDARRGHAPSLQPPVPSVQRDLPEYRRARLLRHYAGRGRRDPGLYLSFVNLSFVGDEGDVFGNLLAILCGLADAAMAQPHRQDAARRACLRSVPGARGRCSRSTPQHALWRAYMERHQQNHPHQYHNGGIWPFVGGFWVVALAQLGRTNWLRRARPAGARQPLDDWRFTEWFHGGTLAPMGMAGQSWNAATYLLARRAVEGGIAVF